MSDFLGRLAARSLGVARIAQPISRGMFASGMGQTQLSQERFTEAASSSIESRAAASSMALTEDAIAIGDSAHESQTDFSVVNPQVARPLNLKTSALRQEPFTSPLRPTDRRTSSRAETQGTRNIGNDSTNEEETSPNQPRRDADSETNLIVPLVNLQREAFPPSSFSAGRSAGRERNGTVSPSAPVVKVSIGRVEVRAEFPAPAPRTSSSRSPSLALSLDEYARQRREGKR